MKAQPSVVKGVWPSILGMALLGGALRVFPFFRPGGALAFPVDYDEGVYFSAASLLLKGAWPYRDFVFVHTPGLLYWLSAVIGLVHSVDVASAFVVTRWVAAGLGVLNIVLIGRVAMRWAGPVAGVMAAAFYASSPDVVGVERGPFLEPLLNAACLAFASLWLAPKNERKPANLSMTVIAAGILCGVAFTVKVWAGIWALAAVASLPDGVSRRRALVLGVSAAVLTVTALVLPLAWAAPNAFVEQVFWFHAQRPPDGLMSRGPRFAHLLGGTHVLSALFALGALASLLRNKTDGMPRETRFWAVVYGLSVLAFILSASYWSQYNAHLAVSECVLGGIGVAQAWAWVRRSSSFPVRFGQTGVSLTVVGAVVSGPSAVHAFHLGMRQLPEQVLLGAAIRERVKPQDCLFSFEPARTVFGGRLQAHEGRQPLVDTYGAMLWESVRSGAHFARTEDAFESNASQATLQPWLETCRFIVLGRRGRLQMSATHEAWFDAHFVRRFPTQPGTAEMDLWERLSPCTPLMNGSEKSSTCSNGTSNAATAFPSSFGM